MNVGGVLSVDQFKVCEVVAVFPQASVAVKNLVCEWIHPFTVSGPSEDVGVIAPLQLSVAIALPRPALIVGGLGLPQIKLAVLVAVIVGGVTSSVQVTVLEAEAVLPQASVTVHVLV